MMSDERAGESRCAEIRAILTWGEEANEPVRGRIADHLAGCPDCAEHGRFVASIRSEMARQRSAHPDPEILVRFAEGDADLAPLLREAIEGHLLVCSVCAGEVEILDAVDRESRAGAAGSPRAARGRDEPSGFGAMLRRIGETLAGSILRPAPAAIYLATAVVAMAVILSERAPIDRPTAPPEAAAPARTIVGGVVLLADRSATGRGDGLESPVPVLPVGGTHFLLLELTLLNTPPDPNAVFDVGLLPEKGGAAAWQGRVRGSEFRENYTLGVYLEAKGIAPGRYSIEVAPAGGGEAIFRSIVEIQPVQ